ncbi:hypothetical protein ACQB6R_06470 [Propionibacteriaceae bacterium G1746]|uniref:hypothetical protein n=1 Tax=Aestuariimicrobium sp. G57 TaxID=3418485 RepID=UPI003C212339
MVDALIPAGIGSLPGDDLGAAVRMLSEATPDVVAVPELPGRGVGADMIGRTGAMLSGLGLDLQPAGWRLVDHEARDQRRARALLRRDLDDLEEHLQGFAGVAKFAVAGPWTMAALVERPRGDKVLGDFGARRELAASLAAGVGELLADMGRRLPQVTWWAQLDEPMLRPVLAGQVATASALHRHRRVDATDAAAALDLFADVAGVVGVHWCGAADVDVMRRTRLSAAAVDIAALATADLDDLSAWLESGRRVWWGTVPTANPDVLEPVDRSADRLFRLFRTLELDPAVLLRDALVTPACGLGLWSPSVARQVLERTAAVATQVTERLHDQLGG